jgi:hypothetical protein
LGARNNKLGIEYDSSAQVYGLSRIPRPRQFPFASLAECTKVANALDWNQEGFVVSDAYFNRCKVKSPKYVLAHFARNNNVITRKHLIDVILRGEMPEFIIYAADYKDQINEVKKLIDGYIDTIDTAGLLARKSLRNLSRAEAAEAIKKFHVLVQPIMFMNLDRLVSGREYVKNWNVNKWERHLEEFTEFLEAN